jgi:hypothetical protein
MPKRAVTNPGNVAIRESAGENRNCPVFIGLAGWSEKIMRFMFFSNMPRWLSVRETRPALHGACQVRISLDAVPSTPCLSASSTSLGKFTTTLVPFDLLHLVKRIFAYEHFDYCSQDLNIRLVSSFPVDVTSSEIQMILCSLSL